ncbi:branched-chain amino acid transport system II carrier protein [Fructobacillus sp. M1-13]|uniref:Branched-chain amino acid transport system carrier protein n=1 Tax=Fructobacillus papyriferae TaxID=2713171 RepID=A0ABS5QN81_9LACO|nr:branched-chain amino acid transport system II carrier protein [Fructobacillus papyriferae]MBS9334549.1 branched-chain amino acid transport system II carrier protein [Fructobacillus papyriferae]MCD2158538.1 branched-chain amino acid transport system II carrier protein [Fructobacillus papyriferae]
MEKKLTWRQNLLMVSLIFGMFFGAGNLIFPVHLGQLAGAAWGQATFGFILSAVLLPLLALVALGVTRSSSVFDLIKPLGPKVSIIFVVVLHFCLGPLVVAPRTATVAYSFSIESWLPAAYQEIGLVIFSLIYFFLVYWACLRADSITSVIGKYLNPAFLILLGVVFVLALVWPMGDLHQHVTSAYQSAPVLSAAIEGYNTVDALASLVLGVAIVHAIEGMGYHKPAHVAKIIVKTGTWALIGLSLVYVGLILLGTTSLGKENVSVNGAIALTQIMTNYFGSFGQVFLAVMGPVAVFTTAMGESSSFAHDFHRAFPKVSYERWLGLAVVIAFLVALLGLDKIIEWAVPVLLMMYPVAIVLVFLNLVSPWLGRTKALFNWSIGLTLIGSIGDGLTHVPFAKALGGFVSYTQNGVAHTGWYQAHVFLASEGFSWLLFSAVGLIIGLLVQFMRQSPSVDQPPFAD